MVNSLFSGVVQNYNASCVQRTSYIPTANHGVFRVLQPSRDSSYARRPGRQNDGMHNLLLTVMGFN